MSRWKIVVICVALIIGGVLVRPWGAIGVWQMPDSDKVLEVCIDGTWHEWLNFGSGYSSQDGTWSFTGIRQGHFSEPSMVIPGNRYQNASWYVDISGALHVTGRLPSSTVDYDGVWLGSVESESSGVILGNDDDRRFEDIYYYRGLEFFY